MFGRFAQFLRRIPIGITLHIGAGYTGATPVRVATMARSSNRQDAEKHLYHAGLLKFFYVRNFSRQVSLEFIEALEINGARSDLIRKIKNGTYSSKIF